MSDLWTEGEPQETGYYLVLVRTRGHPEGNVSFYDRMDPMRRSDEEIR